MAIGEAGSITTNSPTENAPIEIELAEPLTDPVFALTATNNGGNQFTLRIVDQQFDADGNTTHFSFIIEEWEYHDGPHPATETINWLAIEAGVHTLPDGRIIEAGTVEADHTNSAVALTAGFTEDPVVLTSVMSENDTTTVDSDPLNITTSGFDVRLQEEEGQDRIHAEETVGWIAISPGGNDTVSGTAETYDFVDENVDVFGLGTSFEDAVVLAETQTIRGGDTATVVIDSQTDSTVGVFIEEEQSNDSEVNHIDEIVGIVAFEDGLIPCFTEGTRIRTPGGDQKIEHLRAGSCVSVCAQGKPELPPSAEILRVFQRHIDAATLTAFPKLRPVRILAGALNGTLPKQDLLVSRQHRMLVSSQVAKRMFGVPDVLIPAIKLTAMPGIFVDQSIEEVTYFHLLLERHEVVFAEDTPTESLYPGPGALDAIAPAARAEILTIFPELSRSNYTPAPARPMPERRQQKRLVARLTKNRKPILDDAVGQDRSIGRARNRKRFAMSD